ncbi:hypothetical protein ASE78_17475 [Sphingomonas sp. Leaf25]|nr:hypothetical protein ASE78_17475 [Sphingomonas sp. Leaf25]
MRPSTRAEYASQWADESAHLDSFGIYRDLANLISERRVLEIGCGTGRGTAQIAKEGAVLAIDNNDVLLAEARRHNAGSKNVAFCHADLFDMPDTARRMIAEFGPTVIVGWFLGGSGADVAVHTTEQPELVAKGKLYREKIEDIITADPFLVPSVEHIHLVNRSGRIAECSDGEVIEATIKDYDEHVFHRCGFAVAEVSLFDWPLQGSRFRYGAADNPNLAPGTVIPTITAISARRR